LASGLQFLGSIKELREFLLGRLYNENSNEKSIRETDKSKPSIVNEYSDILAKQWLSSKKISIYPTELRKLLGI
jgi:ubiquitin C-terminal hydrolase